ncbi:MAG TPA: D-alanine--(R)-lactate ligase, partial [Chloroflexi bacterium]|nr:D-alanine--(R)-lactate ligase [Chloroflexota bacterium]
MEKTVAVLFGGNSYEYEVSLKSAAAVIRHLDAEKYEPILIGITRQGEWLRYAGSPDRIEDGTWFSDRSCVPAAMSPSPKVHGVLVLHNHGLERIRLDVVFPILHGRLGEDGTVQGLLELSGIPFVGCGTLSSALCMDKDISHVIARAAGIQTPPHVVIKRQDDPRAKIEQADTLGYPLFVKPARAGSSFGITKGAEKEKLPEALRFAFEYDNKVIIEQCVDGFEVGCAVLGNDDPIVGEVDEIELYNGPRNL